MQIMQIYVYLCTSLGVWLQCWSIHGGMVMTDHLILCYYFVQCENVLKYPMKFRCSLKFMYFLGFKKIPIKATILFSGSARITAVNQYSLK